MVLKRVRAGAMRQRVDIKRVDAESTSNGFNELLGTETVHERVPVEIVGIQGRETFRGLKVDATATHGGQIRWIEGLTPDMWMDWGGRRLNFVSLVDPDGRRHSYNYTARELK